MRELFTALEAGARRDKAAEDNVFFQTAQAVYRAAKRGIDENLRRLLKGRGREERTARESALFDTEYNLLRLWYELPCLFHLLDRLYDFPIFDDIANRVVCVAGIGNFHT